MAVQFHFNTAWTLMKSIQSTHELKVDPTGSLNCWGIALLLTGKRDGWFITQNGGRPSEDWNVASSVCCNTSTLLECRTMWLETNKLKMHPTEVPTLEKLNDPSLWFTTNYPIKGFGLFSPLCRFNNFQVCCFILYTLPPIALGYNYSQQ